MSRLICLAASVLICQPAVAAFHPRDLAAQVPSTTTLVARMKSDLKNLVVSQEVHYADYATYATSVGAEPKRGSAYFTPSEDNTVTIANASDRGWTGVITNARLSSASLACGVYVGPPTNAPNAAVTEEGAPACWGTGVQGSGHVLSDAEVDTINIRMQLDSIAAAWNRADLDGHVAIYADTATMMGGRGLIRGKQAIRDGLERSFWRDGKPLQQLRFEEVEVRLAGAGEVAIVTGKFILFGGDTPETSGRFSTIWVKENGRWLTIHDHSS